MAHLHRGHLFTVGLVHQQRIIGQLHLILDGVAGVRELISIVPAFALSNFSQGSQ